MKVSACFRVILFLLVCATIALPKFVQNDDTNIVSKANKTYYNLKTEGLQAFQCNLMVNLDRAAGRFPVMDPICQQSGDAEQSAL